MIRKTRKRKEQICAAVLTQSARSNNFLVSHRFDNIFRVGRPGCINWPPFTVGGGGYLTSKACCPLPRATCVPALRQTTEQVFHCHLDPGSCRNCLEHRSVCRGVCLVHGENFMVLVRFLCLPMHRCIKQAATARPSSLQERFCSPFL